MRNILKTFLEDAGWPYSQSFWIDGSLLALSMPFFIFPSRLILITTILLVLWIIRWILELIFGPKQLRSPFALTLLLFSTWLIVPILVSADIGLTLEKAMGILLGILTWRFIVSYFHSRGSIQLLGALILLLGGSFVVVGFLAVDWLEKIPTISVIVNRFPQQIISFSAIGSGGGVQPNQLAGTLLWLFPFTAGFAVWHWHKQQRVVASLYGLFTLGFIFILVLSQSRGGWLGGLAACGIGIWLATFSLTTSKWLKIGRWLLPAAVLFGVIIGIALLGPNQLVNLWIDPPDSTLVGNLGSLSFRQEVWLWAFQAIQDFPFTGTGLGTFRHVVHKLYPIAIPRTYDIAHAHNVFLQVALDIGLVGLLIYLALLGIYFLRGFMHLINSNSNQWLIIGLLASFTGFHFYGLVDTVALGAKPALLFWLLLATMDRLIVLDSLEM